MDDDLVALRASCDRFLSSHGERAGDLLATVPADTALDRYGEGGVVADLEAEVAGVLGLPAAVYLPSGVMAQQAVLRVHADRRGRRTVLPHPESHLARHEEQAPERLHGLSVGDATMALRDDEVRTAVAALGR
ncbi:Beta-eliminating lyase [Geodermatophilus obscurus]|uniref:Beta-eliminating lyase n=1 Tax=Geodermatophilus obscurus TaxID=1861 RepID=A0A1M7UEB6_9ACTN|nr:beta-eliminating lyase-related protein [Geodermatophilus obscurus]SHN81362.1 Beta-eliminating lyase [Geodermatophilus obscurus]